MHTYEIEIKSLLGSREVADAFRVVLKDSGGVLQATSKQLNHYFKNGNIHTLYEAVADLFDSPARDRFARIANEGTSVSVRTRQANDATLLVVKASIDDTTSENGIARLEFESEVKGSSLDQLDQFLLDAGYVYQAKWSRDREEYAMPDDIVVTVDRNAGYGYVAEFEKLVEQSNHAPEAERVLRALMATCGVEELSQDRLERMFAHYNEHWQDYYGTDTVFVIE